MTTEAEQAEQERIERAKAHLEATAVDENDPLVAPHLARLQETVNRQALRAALNQDKIAGLKAEHDDALGAKELALAARQEADKAYNEASAKYDAVAQRYAVLGLPANVSVSPAEVLSPGEETVPMFFPKETTLIGNNHAKATFEPGINLVPKSYQHHWYVIDSGARNYTGKMPDAAPVEEQTSVRQEVEENVAKNETPIPRKQANVDEIGSQAAKT